MHADEIIAEARHSISQFCMEECNAYCCRKGYILMNAKEKKAVMGISQASVRQIGENFSLYLGDYNAPCPRLKDNKCTIFLHPDRPRICGDFPIMIRDNQIILSPRCLAVKMGKFYPYVTMLIQLGYKLAETSNWPDTECWTNFK